MKQRVYLDANILIAHQVDQHEYHTRAVSLIDDLWKKDTSYVISSLTMDEFLYGVTFILSRVKKSKGGTPFRSFAPILEKSTRAILTWNNIETVDFMHTPQELLTVITHIRKYNLRPRDAFHLQIIKQQHITSIAIFDRDFDSCALAEGITIIGNN